MNVLSGRILRRATGTKIFVFSSYIPSMILGPLCIFFPRCNASTGIEKEYNNRNNNNNTMNIIQNEKPQLSESYLARYNIQFIKSLISEENISFEKFAHSVSILR